MPLRPEEIRQQLEQIEGSLSRLRGSVHPLPTSPGCQTQQLEQRSISFLEASRAHLIFELNNIPE